MKHKRFVRALSGALALAFALSGTPVARPAPAAQGLPDWVQAGPGAGSSAIHAQSQLPVKFDLRERGVVTPVKNQGAWGTCWTFGVSAAAETSILSSMGTTYEGYKAATGTSLDLSERHLGYFAMTPVSKEQDGEQGGEGLSVSGSDFFANAPSRAASSAMPPASSPLARARRSRRSTPTEATVPSPTARPTNSSSTTRSRRRARTAWWSGTCVACRQGGS